MRAPSPAPRVPGLRHLMLAGICSVAGFGHAVAQQAEPAAAPASAPASAAAGSRALEQVVISGSGVERRAFDTPYAVDAVDAQTLRAAGPMVNLSESLARVPGLNVSLRNNYAQDLQISSRGFGARSTFGVRGIRLYTDGIPANGPDGQGQVSHFDLAGAERVEVLRGPFSALYGNSSGGVISLVSGSPQERAFEIGADGGSNGLAQVRVALEAPLGQGWDVRGQFSDFHTDGFRPQSAADRRLANLRVGWRGELDTLVLVVNGLDQPAQDPLGLTRVQFDTDPRQTTPEATLYDTRKNTNQAQIGGQWRHRFANFGPMEEGVITLYTGHRAVTQWQAIAPERQVGAHPGGVIDFDRDYEGLDGRLIWRWDLGERSAQLIAGAAVDRQIEHRRGYANYVGDPPDRQLGVTGALRRQVENEVRTSDVYAQGELEFTHQVVGTVGVRSGRLHIESQDETAGNGGGASQLRFEYTNPVAALQWKPVPALNLYFSAGSGFESPTLTELAYRLDQQPGLNSALQPQRSRQVEIGAKWHEPAIGLALDAALFRAYTEDEIGVQTNQGGRSTYQNVGNTKRRGLEIGARWQASKTLRTVLALTWLDAHYSDDFLTCAGIPCAAPTAQVPAGNRIAGTSAKSAYAELAWRPVQPTEFAVELRVQGNVPVNDLNSDFAPGAVVGALRATHVLPLGGGKLELLARIDNLSDRRYAGSVIVNESNARYFEPAAGRSVLLGAHWRMVF